MDYRPSSHIEEDTFLFERDAELKLDKTCLRRQRQARRFSNNSNRSMTSQVTRKVLVVECFRRKLDFPKQSRNRNGRMTAFFKIT